MANKRKSAVDNPLIQKNVHITMEHNLTIEAYPGGASECVRDLIDQMKSPQYQLSNTIKNIHESLQSMRDQLTDFERAVVAFTGSSIPERPVYAINSGIEYVQPTEGSVRRQLIENTGTVESIKREQVKVTPTKPAPENQTKTQAPALTEVPAPKKVRMTPVQAMKKVDMKSKINWKLIGLCRDACGLFEKDRLYRIMYDFCLDTEQEALDWLYAPDNLTFTEKDMVMYMKNSPFTDALPILLKRNQINDDLYALLMKWLNKPTKEQVNSWITSGVPESFNPQEAKRLGNIIYLDNYPATKVISWSTPVESIKDYTGFEDMYQKRPDLFVDPPQEDPAISFQAMLAEYANAKDANGDLNGR